MRFRVINTMIAAVFASAVLLGDRITVAHAAFVSSESGGMKAIRVIVTIVLFIAASVVSAYSTYRIRMKKYKTEERKDEGSDASDEVK